MQEPCCYREPSWKVWPQGMYPRCFTPVKDGSATTFKLTTFWQEKQDKGKHFVSTGFFSGGNATAFMNYKSKVKVKFSQLTRIKYFTVSQWLFLFFDACKTYLLQCYTSWGLQPIRIVVAWTGKQNCDCRKCREATATKQSYKTTPCRRKVFHRCLRSHLEDFTELIKRVIFPTYLHRIPGWQKSGKRHQGLG